MRSSRLYTHSLSPLLFSPLLAAPRRVHVRCIDVLPRLVRRCEARIVELSFRRRARRSMPRRPRDEGNRGGSKDGRRVGRSKRRNSRGDVCILKPPDARSRRDETRRYAVSLLARRDTHTTDPGPELFRRRAAPRTHNIFAPRAYVRACVHACRAYVRTVRLFFQPLPMMEGESGKSIELRPFFFYRASIAEKWRTTPYDLS